MSSKYLLLLLALSSCAYSTYYVPVERLVYPPTSPDQVAVSTQKMVSGPHKILGRVATITFGGGEAARMRLQEEAARIGANLVIDLRMENGFFKTSASGLAILVTQGKE